MSYLCLEELQVDLDLYALDKTSVLSKVGCKYDDGWLVVTDDGICHLFDKDGNRDDSRKIKSLTEKHIKKDIKKIIIPDNVKSIGDWAFHGCRSLTSVTIGSGVKNIRDGAFEYCDKLMSMIIPDSVTSIGYAVFFGCTSLTSVTIGNGVTRIGEGVFECCVKLTNLIFKGKTLEQVKMMKYYPWRIKDELIIKVE